MGFLKSVGNCTFKWSQQESNLHLKFRKLLFYPLNYETLTKHCAKIENPEHIAAIQDFHFKISELFYYKRFHSHSFIIFQHDFSYVDTTAQCSYIYMALHTSSSMV